MLYLFNKGKIEKFLSKKKYLLMKNIFHDWFIFSPFIVIKLHFKNAAYHLLN